MSMNDRYSIIAGRLTQGRLFIVALLLALASALVPAVLTSGLPSSRATGSAFDPATSVVALRGRTQTIDRAEAVADNGDAHKALPERSNLPLAHSVIVPPEATQAALSYPLADASPATTPRAQARRLTRAQPRAPPHPGNLTA